MGCGKVLVSGPVLGSMRVSLVRANCELKSCRPDWMLPELLGCRGQDYSGDPEGALNPAPREDQDAEAEALKMIRSGVTWESRHACRPGQETG